MELNQVKKLASKVLGIGVSRIRIKDREKAGQAMTRDDVRSLVKQGRITIKPKFGVSKVRARKIKIQKKKGLRKGAGARKGRKKARTPRKKLWMRRVRGLRKKLNILKPELKPGVYRHLYNMIRGGYFRDKGHLTLYIEEHELSVKK
jgi:large subunit ribosomal protein L19e